MLRMTLAVLALTAAMASVSLAGDCASCGIGSGGYSEAAWDGYCGGGGNACGRGCGCKRCCFPLVHCALHKIGCVVNALIPDPCCRRRCNTGCGVSCAQPSCGIEPGCGIMQGGSSDPFIDDHTPPLPTPAADPHARARSWSNAKMMTYPKPVPTPALKPMPMRTAAAPKVNAAPKAKSVAKAKPVTRSVLKVAYDEEPSASDLADDAPPVAPASIREASSEPAIISSAVRFAAKPVVAASKRSDVPANPLRP